MIHTQYQEKKYLASAEELVFSLILLAPPRLLSVCTALRMG